MAQREFSGSSDFLEYLILRNFFSKDSASGQKKKKKKKKKYY